MAEAVKLNKKDTNKNSKNKPLIWLGVFMVFVTTVSIMTLFQDALNPKKVADGEILSLGEADYKLVDKSSHATVDDPCVVKYTYAVDNENIDGEEQFASKTACVEFPLEAGQKVQVQYEQNNPKTSQINKNGKASESDIIMSAVITIGLSVITVLIFLAANKNRNI